MHLDHIQHEISKEKLNTMLGFFNSENYEDAFILAEEMISNHPQEAEPYHILGLISAKQKLPKEALAYIQTAIGLTPENVTYKINLASILLDVQNHVGASLLLEQVLFKFQDNISALNLMGLAYDGMGNFNEAERILLQALSLSPNNVQTKFNLACVYENNEKTDQAIVHYLQILKATSFHLKSVVNLAKIYQTEKRFDDAEALYLKALTDNRECAILNFNLGVFYNERGRYKNAITHFKETLRIDKRFYDAANNLAMIYWRNGDTNSALTCLTNLVEQAPETDKAQLNLCRIVQSTHITHEWSQAINCILLTNFYTKIEKHQLYVDQAIIAWLNNDNDTCHKKLIESAPLTKDTDKKTLNTRAYHHYLSQLIKFRLSNKTLYQIECDKTIYFIGDSHCLSASGLTITQNNQQYKIKSYLVVGAKAWHLSQIENNQFKASLKYAIRRIKKEAFVIFCFGEIDCRVNEGFFPYYLKHRDDKDFDLNQTIFESVKKYVGFIIEVSDEKKLNVMFYGVPAPFLNPNVTVLDKVEREQFISIIAIFNKSLKQVAFEYDIPFIDIYKATVDSSRFAKTGVHIDSFHLNPEVFLNTQIN